MPTSLFTTMLMPSWVAMGNRIGAMISRTAGGSMKLPAAKKQQVHYDQKHKGREPEGDQLPSHGYLSPPPGFWAE